VPVLLLLVALGGVLGSLARCAATAVVGPDEAATLGVNLLGSLAIGLLVGSRPSERARAFAGAGVLGGFTTMSALAVQAVELEPARSAALVAVSVLGGVALCRLGLLLGGRR
jgi:CrcB protein